MPALPLEKGTIQVWDTSLEEVVSWIISRSKQPGFVRLLTLNPEILMAAKDPTIAEIVANADKVVADGMGIVACIRWAYGRRVARVPGSDIVPELLRKGSLRLYLLGGTPASVRLAAQHPAVCGWHDGFFTEAEWPEIQAKIVSAEPDVVLVGMGFPRQDRYLMRVAEVSPRGVGIGVGGVIDMLAGIQPRAPKWVQKMQLEWAYRICREPQRLKRLLAWAWPFLRYTYRLWWSQRRVRP